MGRAFAVLFRRDLVVCDGDRADAAQAVQKLATELEKAGHASVVWASGRPGHRQIIFTVSSRREWVEWCRCARDLGLEPRTRSRPPLSPHRLALPVALLRPATVRETVEVLQQRPQSGSESHGGVSAATWRRIRHGDPTLPSGSEVVHRIAIGFVASGHDAEWAYRILLKPENLGGEALRKRLAQRGEVGARRWFFEYVWPPAEDWVAEHPPISDPTAARAAITAIKEEIDHHPWPSVVISQQPRIVRVAGSSVLRCLEGIIAIALKAGTIVPYVSTRHLADVAGFGSTQTARRAVQALAILGWIKPISKGTGRRASTYRLLAQGRRKNDTQRQCPSASVLEKHPCLPDKNQGKHVLETSKNDPQEHTPEGGGGCT